MWSGRGAEFGKVSSPEANFKALTAAVAAERRTFPGRSVYAVQRVATAGVMN